MLGGSCRARHSPTLHQHPHLQTAVPNPAVVMPDIMSSLATPRLGSGQASSRQCIDICPMRDSVTTMSGPYICMLAGMQLLVDIANRR